MESIKKWVLKPHCRLGSQVKRPGIPRIGDRFPHSAGGLAEVSQFQGYRESIPAFATWTSTRFFMLSIKS
jgi:hypothetical protein